MDLDRRPTPTWAWLAVATLTVGLVVENTRRSIERYRDLDSGWSWDLAYYNQWFWALTKGDGTITARPAAPYGREGLSVWRSNYLAPIRLAIAPIYAIRPGPETLLAVEAALFWLAVPAAFALAKGESGSVVVGLTAAGLVPLTPLLGPLAANDFRELQMALPFGLVAMEGVRGRRAGWAVAGVVGLLACRQELAVVVAMLAIVPPRAPEDLGRSARWAGRLWLVGVGWTLLFLAYLALTRSESIPGQYLAQFRGPRAHLGETVETTAELLLIGLGAWGVLAWRVPGAGLGMLFWAWTLGSGRWALRSLGTAGWHSVRYAAPLALTGLAAGVLGFARVAARLRPGWARVGLVGVAGLVMILGRIELESRSVYTPRPLPRREVAHLWDWIGQVGPDDGVLADYDVAAPLSSRRVLTSYIIPSDKGPDFPRLGPWYRFVFARPRALPPETFTAQGFDVVYRGDPLWVYRRPGPAAPPPPGRREPAFTDRPYWLRWLAIAQGHLLPLAASLGLLWPWLRLRRAWRVASGRATDRGDAGEPVAIVSDAPRDLADPARRVVRLSAESAGGRTLADATLAAFEAEHLRIALGQGLVARLARLRPALLIAARLATASGRLAMAVGVALGSGAIFGPGVPAFAVGVLSPLVLIGIERGAARRVLEKSGEDVDPVLLAVLPWRHVAEAVPIPWRPRR